MPEKIPLITLRSIQIRNYHEYSQQKSKTFVCCPSLCFQSNPVPCPCAWGVRNRQILHPQRRSSCHTSSSSLHHPSFSHSLYPAFCLPLCLCCGCYHGSFDGRVTCLPLWTPSCPSWIASQASLVLISCHPLVCLACLP